MSAKIIMQDVSVKPPAEKQRWAVFLFACTIFTGAFLLFGVQPLIGRFLLPWFGGTPEVWTTCMLFFQLFLLAGYAWAHLIIRFLSPRRQVFSQVLLLITAVSLLSVAPDNSLKPSSSDNPILKILYICTICVGLPYFLLSTTGPLLQAWFARLFTDKVPWRFYALGNTASLLALIGFPLFFEPNFTRFTLARGWWWGFLLYSFFYVFTATLVWRQSPVLSAVKIPASNFEIRQSGGWRYIALWLALPACASVELLAVTAKITQDIAAIPFLWILPLGLYLLSFIICFDHPRWYSRRVFLSLFIAGIAGVILVYNIKTEIHIGLLIALYAAMLFFCSMVCHGELYRLRPHTSGLTRYYLCIAAGGAVGGIFVAVIAPLIFRVYHELHLGLLACSATVLMVQEGLTHTQQKRRILWIGALLTVGAAGIFLQGKKTINNQTAIENRRNFFGVLTIWEETASNPQMNKLLLQHGTTFHGLQFQDPAKKSIPTAYYSPQSGIGLYLTTMPKQDERRIGIVGLGVGTIASYGHPADVIRFYEINPEVEPLARKYFSYLSDSRADIEIILGDARLTMENEPPQKYDVLVLDAFSSDSVPVHLLTREAFDIYLKHLADDGVLAFHISTQHLNLHSVIWKAAEHFGLSNVWIENDEIPDSGALAADWILLSRNASALEIPAIVDAARRSKKEMINIPLWTDDYINFLAILK